MDPNVNRDAGWLAATRALPVWVMLASGCSE